MKARARHLALPAGASAPEAFASSSNPGTTHIRLSPTATPAWRGCAALHAIAAEATTPWAQPLPPPPLPTASLGEARSLRDLLADLLARERTAASDFLAALADFDRRRGWEALGHASLFAFLTRELRLSGAAAYARLSAARLLPRFPEVEVALREGRLCVTSTGELAKVLTPENLGEVLPRFFGLSSREARNVVAALSPKAPPRSPAMVTRLSVLSPPAPETPNCVVRVPEQHNRVVPGMDIEATPAPLPAPSTTTPGSGAGPCATNGENRSGLAGTSDRGTLAGAGAGAGAGRFALEEGPARISPPGGAGGEPQALSLPESSVEPLTAEFRRLHMTVRTAFLDKLHAARRGMDHARPRASLEEVLEAALDLLLEKQARRRGEVKRPRRGGGAKARSGETAASRKNAGVENAGVENAGVEKAGVEKPSLQRAGLETAGPEKAGLALVGRDQVGLAPSAMPGALAPRPGVADTGGSPCPDTSRCEGAPAASRHIAATVRREVWARDDHRCQFPLDAGGRCGSQHRLELDHVVPVALGGASTAENLRVICQAHNLVAARTALGEARMADPRRPGPLRSPGRNGT